MEFFVALSLVLQFAQLSALIFILREMKDLFPGTLISETFTITDVGDPDGECVVTRQ